MSKSPIHLGAIEELRDNVEEGLDILQRALSIAEKTDHRPPIALALNNIGVIKYRRGEYEIAINSLTRANEMAESSHDVALASMSVNNLGNVHYDKGNLDSAKESYKSAIRSQRQCRNEEILAGYLGNLGLVYLELGEFHKSISSIEEAVFLFSERNNRYGRAVMLSNLSNVYNEIGKYRKGINICRQALSISRDLNTPCPTAETLSNLGYAFSRIGEHKPAGEAFTEALELMEGIEEPITLSQILVEKALFQIDGCMLEQAVTTLERAQNIYKKLDQTKKIIYCQSLLANFYSKLGNKEEAGRFCRDVETALDDLPNTIEKVKCTLNIGSALRMNGVYRKAFVLLRSAYLGFFKNNVIPGLVQSLSELGFLAFDTGKFPQAAAYLTSASEVFNTIDASPPEVERIATLLDKTIKVIKEKKLDLIVFTPDNPPELE